MKISMKYCCLSQDVLTYDVNREVSIARLLRRLKVIRLMQSRRHDILSK